MAKKFHLSDRGPAPCTATVRECPIGGEHFQSMAEAVKAFEHKMSGESLPKTLNKTFTMEITPATTEVLNKLAMGGMKPLIVGGSVRDKFLGLDNKDIDIEVYGVEKNGDSISYDSIKKVFKRSEGYKIDEAGASFSVLKIRHRGEDFDISLPRTEQTTGDGHKDYNVQHDSRLTFDEAASRRDFTINSMAYNYATGELVDPYGGANDIKNKTLRHISEAFSDDPLRCLRAVNFASRFNFTVHPETINLCKELSKTYDSLPRERVEEEFNKVFYKGKHCDVGFKVLDEIGWREKMPPFKKTSGEILSNYGEKLNKVSGGLERKAMLAHMMVKDGYGTPTDYLESSGSNKRIINRTVSLLNSLDGGDKAAIVKAHRDLKNIYKISNGELKKISTILNVNGEALDGVPETPAPQVVTGKRLLELGYKPGPDMGKLINRAQYFQDRDGINDFDELLRKSLS